jgi:hypothetical protein
LLDLVNLVSGKVQLVIAHRPLPNYGTIRRKL